MNIQEFSRRFSLAVVTTGLLVLTVPSSAQGEETAEAPAQKIANGEVSFDLRLCTGNPNAAAAHANNAVVYGEWTGPALVNGIPAGHKVIDGDIVVPDGSDAQLAATYATNLWPGGVVPYEFDANVTPANAAAMLVAMSWWESVATIDFVPRTIEFNFIHVQNNTFNNSPVGMKLTFGTGQIINIVSWNNTGVMAHELGHSLGYWHEQSSVDRDSFVTINLGNVCQNCCPQSDGSMGSCNFNFQIEDTSSAFGDYDFDSIMHYGRCAFSNNPAACGATCPSNTGETVVVKAPNNSEWQCSNPAAGDNTGIGQSTHLSYWDSVTMSFMYPRANWRFQSNVYGFDFFSGDFLFPVASFAKGYSDTPVGGTLWILDPATIAVGGVLDKPITIGAPLGGVTLTP